MAYFLGRDVKLAISTEQEAFGIKKISDVLDITGTDVSAKVASGSLLNGTVAVEDEDVAVDNGTHFSVKDVILVNSEKMLVTAISSNTLTVIRGYLGTTAPSSHADDSIVYKVSHAVNSDDIPPRPYALKASGTTGVKEVTTITIDSGITGANLES